MKVLPVAALLALLVAMPAAAAAQVEITYLGNEGFLLAAAGEDGKDGPKVLIDALFGDGIRGYGTVPPAERERLENAAPPYDGAVLVLASHFHRDHFDPAAVARYLRANPRARFVSTRQAVTKLLRQPGAAAFEGRVEGHWPAEGESARIEHGGVTVTLLNLHHGRDRAPPVENLGTVIELGGRKILHVGDTEVDLDDIAAYRLDRAAIDVALLPSWFFVYDRWRAVVDHLGARHEVVMHLAEPDAPATFFGSWESHARVLARLRAFRPGAILLDKLERRTL